MVAASCAEYGLAPGALQGGDQMKHYHIDIGGMTCEHCANSVAGAVEAVDGIQACKVDLSSKSASVELDESEASVAKAVQAVISAGYSVGGFRELVSAPPQQT